MLIKQVAPIKIKKLSLRAIQSDGSGGNQLERSGAVVGLILNKLILTVVNYEFKKIKYSKQNSFKRKLRIRLRQPNCLQCFNNRCNIEK